MNGKRVDQHVFTNGDRIHLAPTVAILYRQENITGMPPHPPPPSKPLRQRAQVFIEIDGQIRSQRELDKEVLTVGRAHNASGLLEHDIAIPSRYVARKLHAQLVWQNNAWVIRRHPEAENGLEYNGKRIDQHVFSHGDRVYLGPGVALCYQALP
jgi:hypothetical protein